MALDEETYFQGDFESPIKEVGCCYLSCLKIFSKLRHVSISKKLATMLYGLAKSDGAITNGDDVIVQSLFGFLARFFEVEQIEQTTCNAGVYALVSWEGAHFTVSSKDGFSYDPIKGGSNSVKTRQPTVVRWYK
jgi:hypothetical protein